MRVGFVGRREECPLGRALPTGVAHGPTEWPQRRTGKKERRFFKVIDTDNTFAPRPWGRFLHWNNSNLENTYCIKSF
jgi:hypothetical protein